MNWLTRGMSANVPRIAQTKPVWRYQPNARFEPCRQWIGPDKRPRCQFPGTYRGREIAKCWTSRYRSLLGEDSAPLASVPQSLGLCFLECSYDLPMRIPVTNTSAPPSPTCIAAENTGVSMNRCRTHVIT